MRFLPAVLLMLPVTAFAQQATEMKTYPPQYKSAIGAEIALLAGTWADDGIGVHAHFDTIQAQKLGPGHSTAGAFALLAFADDDDGPCDREESILALGGRLKYVADIHPVVRPWGGAGVGIYSVNRDDDPCTNPDEDDEMGVGIPISFGVDFALQTMTLSVSLNAHGNTADDDFTHLGLGAAWRF